MPGSNKTLFRIHSWVGLTCALLLFIVCFSGAIATVSSEIDWLFNPAMRADSIAGTGRSWEQWYQSVSAAHPKAHILSLSAPPAAGWAASATVLYRGEPARNVLIHPGTGKVQGTFSLFNVARFFRSFHKQFYIYPGSLPHGTWIVGPFALVLLLSVATGLSFYKIRWKDLILQRRNRGLRTWLSLFHRSSGVWMLAFSLIFALTGLWYFAERITDALGVPLPSVESLEIGKAPPHAADAQRINLDAAVAAARQAFPELEVQVLYFPARKGSAITLYGDAAAWLARPSANYVLLDPYSGQVLGRGNAADLRPFLRLAESIDPLHFGSFGGLPVKLLWLVAGLVISAAVLSGTYLWFLRLRQSAAAQETLSPTVARGAIAVTLAVLGLTTYGSVVNIGASLGKAPVPSYVWIVVGAFLAVTVLVSILWLSALAASPVTRLRGNRQRAAEVGAELNVR